MKINSDMQRIVEISRPPQQPIKHRQQKTAKNFVEISRLKKIKPIDLLSNDELTMLKQLFPVDKEKVVQEDFYAINRRKQTVAKLGSLVDVKW